MSAPLTSIQAWNNQAETAIQEAQAVLNQTDQLDEGSILQVRAERILMAGEEDLHLRLHRIGDEIDTTKRFLESVVEVYEGRAPMRRPDEIDILHNLRSHTQDLKALISALDEEQPQGEVANQEEAIQVCERVRDLAQAALDETQQLQYGSREAMERILEDAHLSPAQHDRAMEIFCDELADQLAADRRLVQEARNGLNSVRRLSEGYQPVASHRSQIPADLSPDRMQDFCATTQAMINKLQEDYAACLALADPEHDRLQIEDGDGEQ